MSEVERQVGFTTHPGGKQPLVSIIIPFFNLHDCVDYCLRNVLSQTFEDFEVICIDDGSTDGTGELLDRFAEQDGRIRVFHKENGGLSEARNDGVVLARGKFISFVDGDDVISPHYLSALVGAMQGREDRMVIAKSKSVSQADIANGSGAIDWEIPGGATEVTREGICALLLSKVFGTIACAKLAPRELYLKHPFPIGLRYEELLTICDFISGVDSYCVIREPIYAYVMRAGSIVWAKRPSVRQAREYLDAVEYSAMGFECLCPNLRHELMFYRAVMLTRVHDFIKRGLDDPIEQDQMERHIRSEVNSCLSSALRNRSASRAQRVRVALYARSPLLYDRLIDLYNHRVKGLTFG